MNKERKQYPKKFKDEVLQFLDSHPEMTHKEVANTFGLDPYLVSRWNRKRNPYERKVTPATDDIRAQQKEMARLREENEILKKSVGHFLGTKEMIYKFMKNHSDVHCIKIMASALKVSRSGYYAWLSRKESNRARENCVLLDLIKKYQKITKQSYGAKRLTLTLKSDKKMTLGHNRVARLMKLHGLNAMRKRNWRKPKEEKDLDFPIKNILDRNFDVDEPNKVWVSDITYIKTNCGWRYHCAIMDLFNRGIVGRSFSSRYDTDLITEAFQRALENRNNPTGVLFHSDRGSQYCSGRFRELLDKNGFIQSLSRRGNCWDNACIESYFKSLKCEWLYPEGLVSPWKAEMLIVEYVEGFYNRIRKHSSLGFLSPMEYELKVVS